MMKETKMKRVPKLRFPEFTDDWEQRKCKAVAPLQRGFDLPISQMVEGEYPVVMSNGIGGYHNEYKVKGPGVITGRSGTIGKIQYIESDYWPHNTALWVTDFKNNYPQFIFYLYMNLDLSRFGTGSGVPTLNRNDVHDALVYVPNLDEQKKLAAYFNSIDHLITLHQRKLEKLKELRKGVMKKLFSQEVRFKADDGSEFPDWEEKKLGDDVQFINGRAYKQDELLNSGKYLVLRVGNLFTNDSYYYSDLELDNDKYIENGDLIYAWSATFGPRIYYGEKCIYHYHIWKLKFDENIISKIFLNYYLLYDVEKIKSQRTGGTMVHITKNAMEHRELQFPCLAEQQKIADCLSTLDDVIEKQKATLAAWEELKKGLLQQMFV